MIPTNRASLSLQADNLLRARLSLLDLDEFPAYIAEVRITLAALCHQISSPLDLSMPTLYHYRALLANLQVRIDEAEREFAARQAEEAKQQAADDGEVRRRYPGRFGPVRMRTNPPPPDETG